MCCSIGISTNNNSNVPIANNIAAADTVTVLDKVKTGTKAVDTSTDKLAKTVEKKTNPAIKKLKDALKAARSEMRDFAQTTSAELSGMVSLRDAFDTNSAANDAVTESLRDRASAYKALDSAKQGDDAQNLADALQAVADAEANVTAAQQKRASTSTIGEFQTQVRVAGQFAANLKELVLRGLGPDGLAQLLNLGPTVGYAVTDQLITVPSSFNEFQKGLADLSSSAQSLGLSTSSAFFGGAVNTAATNARNAGITVNVSAGIVSTPAQMGQQVIDAILAAQRTGGKVFLGV